MSAPTEESPRDREATTVIDAGRMPKTEPDPKGVKVTFLLVLSNIMFGFFLGWLVYLSVLATNADGAGWEFFNNNVVIVIMMGLKLLLGWIFRVVHADFAKFNLSPTLEFVSSDPLLMILAVLTLILFVAMLVTDKDTVKAYFSVAVLGVASRIGNLLKR